MLPFMIEFVKSKYGDEIRDYYEKEIRKWWHFQLEQIFLSGQIRPL
jgi:hypothetical protein